MQQRIIGFDLARAYAILGMFIVNFNFSFGSIMAPTDGIGRFLNIFTGNSTAIFIICAGMGVSLMTSRIDYSEAEKRAIKSKILKRSWFLFAIGLLLFNWWSGDILHFYGGYMHFAAFLLFVPKQYYLWLALVAILLFHLLLFIVPIETGWDFRTFEYVDFWTPGGFLRNTLYNGWNSMFPWLSYFFTGMWLGRLRWDDRLTRMNIFFIGFLMFSLIQVLRFLAKLGVFSTFWTDYVLAGYFPPYFPFIVVTIGFAFMAIAICMYVGEKFSANKFVKVLQLTGQMTLSHYVIHLTLGMMIFAGLTDKNYTGFLEDEAATKPIVILAFSIGFYILSVLFSLFWRRRFSNGPLEMLMRRFSG